MFIANDNSRGAASGPPRWSMPSSTSSTGTSSWAGERAVPTLSCRALTWSRLTSASPLPCLPLPPLSSVDAAITPVYGRLTCTLEMEVYEGPYVPLGRHHGDGATCAKMDGGAKFMGRYHAVKILSGILIVAGEATFVYGEHIDGG